MQLISSDAIEVIHSSGIAHVFLTAGATGNKLSAEGVFALSRHVQKAMRRKGCRALVLRSRGGDFCTGIDIDPAQATTAGGQFTDLLALLHNAPILTVAFVEGAAHGAGLGLAAACDVLIAAPTATFALPETTQGLIPALTMPTLIRRLPIGKAKTLAVSQRTLNATEALSIGLADDVGAEDKLYAQLQALMRSAPEAISSVKTYLNDLVETPPDVHGELAIQAYSRALASQQKLTSQA